MQPQAVNYEVNVRFSCQPSTWAAKVLTIMVKFAEVKTRSWTKCKCFPTSVLKLGKFNLALSLHSWFRCVIYFSHPYEFGPSHKPIYRLLTHSVSSNNMNPLNPLSAQSRFELKIFELLYITLDCGNDDCCYGGFSLLLVKHLRHSNNNTRPVWSEKRCDPVIMFVAQLFGCSALMKTANNRSPPKNIRENGRIRSDDTTQHLVCNHALGLPHLRLSAILERDRMLQEHSFSSSPSNV